MSSNANKLSFPTSFFGKRKQKTVKPNLVLFNYVHDDGIGDFKHLCDFLPHFERLLTPSGVDIIIFIVNRHDESSDQTAYTQNTSKCEL